MATSAPAIARSGHPIVLGPTLHGAAAALACGLAFGLLAYGSIDLTRCDGRVAAVWIPNGLALACLLRVRMRSEYAFYLALMAGNIAANVLAGDVAGKAAALSLANTLEIALAATLVRRFCSPLPDMRDIRHLVAVCGLAGVVAPVPSALLASLFLSGGSDTLAALFGKWWLTDALGMVIITPCVLVVADALRKPRLPSRRQAGEWVALLLVGTGMTIAVFAQTNYPLLFLVGPVVVTAAFRLGTLGTALATILVSAIATFFTWAGSGPVNLVDEALGAELLVLHTFIASAFLVGMPVAAVLEGRGQMIETLAARQEELDLLTSNISDAVLRFDAQGVCTYVSPSVADVLGTGPETFLGARTTDRMHAEAKETISAANARLMSGESQKERFVYRRMLDDEEGKPVYIEADCVMARHPGTGEREGIIFSARDITERVLLERQLVRARRHAENAARAKSEFLANMSHEIRTPMNGVLGFAELLRAGELGDKERRQADLIYESGRSMMLLLNDILDISKIEAGQIVISPEPVDVAHLLDGCVRLHAAHAEQKGIALGCDIEAGLHDRIMVDQLRLRQVVLNLIGNAVKFTEKGHVRVRARAGRECLEICVEDSGIGIPKDRLELVFKPFQQADGRISRRFGGTGLGLSISRHLAGLMGGSLKCESVAGEGSRFTLSLPHVEGSAGSASAARPASCRLPVSLPPPARILLAEDHDVNRMLVGAMLERCGQGVENAVDGTEAVAKVLAAEKRAEPYDLVLMDVQMPGMDGYSAARRIRNHGIDAARLPIVALTANAFPEDINAARLAGMQTHLAKPLVFAELVAVLNSWLPNGSAPKEREEAVIESAAPSRVMRQAEERWRERRAEALEAICYARELGELDCEQRETLARTVHKLAGTAGMFGEAELGLRASALERALKQSCDADEHRAKAEELLALA